MREDDPNCASARGFFLEDGVRSSLDHKSLFASRFTSVSVSVESHRLPRLGLAVSTHCDYLAKAPITTS